MFVLCLMVSVLTCRTSSSPMNQACAARTWSCSQRVGKSLRSLTLWTRQSLPSSSNSKRLTSTRRTCLRACRPLLDHVNSFPPQSTVAHVPSRSSSLTSDPLCGYTFPTLSTALTCSPLPPPPSANSHSLVPRPYVVASPLLTMTKQR